VPTSAAGLKVKPHEMFLWVDPNNDDRALLFISTPALTTVKSGRFCGTELRDRPSYLSSIRFRVVEPMWHGKLSR